MHVSTTQAGKPKKSNYIGQSMLASAGSGAVQLAAVPVSVGIMKTMNQIGKIPADKIEILHKAAEQAIKDTGLATKGVSITYLKEPTIKNGLKSLALGPIAQIQEGFNAAYTSKPIKDMFGKLICKGNTVLMPEKAISFASFHEIGHAMNYNFSKIGRLLQHTRMPGMIAASALALYGAFSTQSKPKDGKELTKRQKVNNFIRNNAGKLSFAAMVPMLIEEAMATIKGNKLAGKLLSPEMLKHVKKGNAVAYLSYLTAATGLGLAAWAGVKIKDKLVERKENKIQQNKINS